MDDEATVLARKAAEEGFENVISVGGDGTILEVATGLVGSGCTMGIIPAGTGNDFVRSLGMTVDAELAAKMILEGNTKLIDIAKLKKTIISSTLPDAASIQKCFTAWTVLKSISKGRCLISSVY